MAKEIQALAPAGSNVYAQIVRQSDGQYWNPAGAFEAYATANISSYALAMAQAGTASGFYTADFPAAIAAGRYSVIARIRAGAQPAESDNVIAVGDISWTALSHPDMLDMLWRWYYRKNEYDSVAQTIRTFEDDGTTPVSTAAATVVAGVEVKGAAL